MTTPELQAAVEVMREHLFTGQFTSVSDVYIAGQTILTALEAAQQELTELRRDKEIVDWMERARPSVLCLCKFGEGELVTGYLWEINDLHEAKTFREAANAAIQKAT